MTTSRLILAAALSVLVARTTSAQTSSGGFGSATVSAVNIEDGTSASFAGAIGYRFNPAVAVGVEIMFVPSLTPKTLAIPTPLVGLNVPDFGGVSFPSPGFDIRSEEGHATIFTTHLRLTVPTRFRRISPYLIGGAGAASITDRVQYTITYPPIALAGIGSPIILPSPFPQRESLSRTTTDFAVSFGGGVSFLMNDHWSLDGDARYIGVFGRRDDQIGRYGGGITYRF